MANERLFVACRECRVYGPLYAKSGVGSYANVDNDAHTEFVLRHEWCGGRLVSIALVFEGQAGTEYNREEVVT